MTDWQAINDHECCAVRGPNRVPEIDSSLRDTAHVDADLRCSLNMHHEKHFTVKMCSTRCHSGMGVIRSPGVHRDCTPHRGRLARGFRAAACSCVRGGRRPRRLSFL